MINRPKLQDLREDDLQLTQVTRDLSLQVNKQSIYIFGTLALFVGIYVYGVHTNFYSKEMAFLIGLPIFVVSGGIGLLWVQIYQSSLFNTTLNEYDNRHLLHRLEEVHETLIKIEEKISKDKINEY